MASIKWDSKTLKHDSHHFSKCGSRISCKNLPNLKIPSEAIHPASDDFRYLLDRTRVDKVLYRALLVWDVEIHISKPVFCFYTLPSIVMVVNAHQSTPFCTRAAEKYCLTGFYLQTFAKSWGWCSRSVEISISHGMPEQLSLRKGPS